MNRTRKNSPFFFLVILFFQISCVVKLHTPEEIAVTLSNGSSQSTPTYLGLQSFLRQLGTNTTGGTATLNDTINGITVDALGNSYIVGETYSSIGEANGGNSDAYLAKFDPSGTLVWVRQLGNTTIGGTADDGLDKGVDVVLDTSGNIYMNGNTTGSLGEPTGGSNDAFIAKFNADGDFIWIRQMGDTTLGAAADYNDQVTALAIDSDNKLIIAGYTWGSMGDTNSSLNVSPDAFIAKYDTDGNFQWASQIGHSAMGNTTADDGIEQIYDVDVDGNKNIYITGYTSGSLVETFGGGFDIILAKFNSAGVLQWVSHVGDTTVNGVGNDGIDIGYGVDIDASGNIFVAGRTNGSLAETNGGDYDVVVARFNPSGSLQWIRQMGNSTIGGTADNGLDSARVCKINGDGKIIIAGFTNGSLAEANGGGGAHDVFVASYNSSGVFQWVKQLGEATVGGSADDGADVTTSMVLDSYSSIYIGGQTTGSLGDTNDGSNDAFLIKLTSSGDLDLDN